MAFGATVGAAKSSDYGGYMAARFFQGLGVSPAATVGLAVVNDMFFEHERGQKVGIWVLAIDSGLLVVSCFRVNTRSYLTMIRDQSSAVS